MTATDFNTLFRDFVNAGVPSSGRHKPVKDDVRDTFNALLGSASTAAEDVRSHLAAAPYVATRTALKALDATKDTAAILTESGREGLFIFDGSDLSAEVTLDTEEGVYVPPDSDSDGSSGAWVRHRPGKFSLVSWFGATGDGSTDDTTALQAAVDSLGDTGGFVDIDPSHKISITDLTIPRFVTLRGQFTMPGEGNWSSLDFRQLGSQILLDSAGTITLEYGAAIKGCAILRDGVTANPASGTYAADAAAIKAAFAGTAITVAGNNVAVEDTIILGFARAIDSDGYTRGYFDKVFMDCTYGIRVDNAYDLPRLNRCHAWPFLTNYNPNFGTSDDEGLTRSGVAFDFGDVDDGISATNCFSFGWETGFEVNGADEATLVDCWADYPPSVESTSAIGFHILGSSRNPAIVGCKSSGTGRGLVQNNSNTDSCCMVTNWRSHVVHDAHIENFAGEMVLTAPKCVQLGGLGTIAVRTDSGAGYTGIIAGHFEDLSNVFVFDDSSNVDVVAPRLVNCSGGLAYINWLRQNLRVHDQVVIGPSGANEGGQLTLQPGTGFSGDVALDRYDNDARLFANDSIAHVFRFQNFGAGSMEIAVQGGVTLGSYAATSIADAANAINTTNKAAGKVIRDSTNNRLVVASGSGATDPWYVVDGSASVTPA